MKRLPSSRTYGWWLAVVRVLTGLMWLIHGVPKFLNSDAFMPPNGVMAQYIQQGTTKSIGSYHDFLVNIVQPNISLFAELVRFGEVCVGLSLVFGLFTRLGGFVGIILPLNYLSARGGLGSFTTWSSTDACMLLLSAINLVLPTGRVLGVDALFGRGRPEPTPPVHVEFVEERPLNGPTAPP